MTPSIVARGDPCIRPFGRSPARSIAVAKNSYNLSPPDCGEQAFSSRKHRNHCPPMAQMERLVLQSDIKIDFTMLGRFSGIRYDSYSHNNMSRLNLEAPKQQKASTFCNHRGDRDRPDMRRRDTCTQVVSGEMFSVFQCHSEPRGPTPARWRGRPVSRLSETVTGKHP